MDPRISCLSHQMELSRACLTRGGWVNPLKKKIRDENLFYG